jgi:hypothetical protein
MKTLAPNGQVLSVQGNPHGFFGPWGFETRLRRGTDTLIFTSGTVGSFEMTMEALGMLDKLRVRSATAGRRKVSAYEDAADGGTHFVWSGPHHEVLTYTKAVGLPIDRFLRVLGAVDLADGREGVRISPRKGTGAQVQRMLGYNTVPEVCSVTVEPATNAVDMVPAWKGVPVAGGELWRLDDDERRTATLANTTAVTTLAGHRERLGELADLARSMRLTFSKA